MWGASACGKAWAPCVWRCIAKARRSSKASRRRCAARIRADLAASVPDGALVHAIFDIAAWSSAWAMSRLVARRGYLGPRAVTLSRNPGYFIALGLGAMAGAILFGSLNMSLAGI